MRRGVNSIRKWNWAPTRWPGKSAKFITGATALALLVVVPQTAQATPATPDHHQPPPGLTISVPSHTNHADTVLRHHLG